MDNTPYIIAEIGKNFIQTEEEHSVEEYLENAKALAHAAHSAGADAVKFQTHNIEDEILDEDFDSPHFEGQSRYEWVKRNTEATPILDFWEPLQEYCMDIGITFFSTPMSRGAAILLEGLDAPFWKIGSGDVRDYALLSFIKKTQKPVILSTGMVSYQELADAVSFLGDTIPLTILYCVSEYPTPPEAFNLSSFVQLNERHPHAHIGFSDHSLGDEAALAAVNLGATVIEKHFSFDRGLWGPDHKVSLTPDEFSGLVEKVRSGVTVDVSPYWGDMNAELPGATNQFRPYFDKTLVAARDLEKGDRLSEDDIYAMRPRLTQVGFPATDFPSLIGTSITHDCAQYEMITGYATYSYE